MPFLIQVESLLEETRLSLLIVKNILLLSDTEWLRELKTNELYNNAIHTVIESILSYHLAKERDKDLRRNFKSLEIERNMFLEENRILG